MTFSSVFRTLYIVALAAAAAVVSCAPGSENVVPELILDVPDQIKPDIRGIMLRIRADDIYPFEIDLAGDRELIIPTGKGRTINALVSGPGNRLIASGTTVCDIAGVNPKIEISLAVPPAAPRLTVTGEGTETTLRWSRYRAAADTVAFAAYRVYRSPVDEVSQLSDLAAAVTDPAETVFTDGAAVGGAGYYRVYVYEKSGAFNGSPVVGTTDTANTPDSPVL